jgi:NADH-quinone oxidoreductase subunit N
MMTPFSFAQLAPAAPEVILAVGSLVLLMIGAFRGDRSTRVVAWHAVTLLVIALVALLEMPADTRTTFGGMFVIDRFAIFMKALVLIGAILAIPLSLDYARREGMERIELPVVMVLATLGMLMMISANDLISLYVGLELQSLSLYVLAAFKRDSERASEAGLKYFVLGALSSGMLLYGASMIYGFTGSTSFPTIAAALGQATGATSIGLIVGIVFLSAGLAFKVSAVPFHMWTPDVYEGAPTPITAFFAVAPKVAAMALFVRALVAPFGTITAEWQQIIVFVAIASMILGSVAAIVQTNIKRLMAYSSIGHVGFALVGLAAGNAQGIQGVLIYMATYVAMNIGTFAVILSMRGPNGMMENINDLAGLSRTRPMMALVLGIFMFSLAGIPPMAGFFAKFYVFAAAIDAHLYALAVIGVLASVVGAYYYLRIVKIMYFDEPAVTFEPMPAGFGAVLTGTGLFTIGFVLFASPLVSVAALAAKSLLPG